VMVPNPLEREHFELNKKRFQALSRKHKPRMGGEPRPLSKSCSSLDAFVVVERK
jgi:hypothetical protein